MEDKRLLELSESFRKGLINRRDFIQKVILSAGGVIAASQVLSQLGFDAGLIQEVKAEGSKIVIEEDTFPSGEEKIAYYLAAPAKGGPFRTMIVIHEIFGLSNFIKDVVRLFAQNGYLAMAPCLSEGNCQLPDGKHAQWMLDVFETGDVIIPLDEQVKLMDGFNWLAKREDVDASHIGSVGFCWGGARSFYFATRNPDLWAAVVFYGSRPPVSEFDKVQCPILELCSSTAGDLNPPNGPTANVVANARELRMRGKIFEFEVYNDSGHGFFRDGTPPDDHVSDKRPAVLAKDLMFDFLERRA